MLVKEQGVDTETSRLYMHMDSWLGLSDMQTINVLNIVDQWCVGTEKRT